MKKILILSLLYICSSNATAATFWTIKSKGTAAFGNGKIAMHLDPSFQPNSPSPVNSIWSGCLGGLVYFHSDSSGTDFETESVNRMSMIAVSAAKTRSNIRIALEKTTAGYCYTSQIFDQG